MAQFKEITGISLDKTMGQDNDQWALVHAFTGIEPNLIASNIYYFFISHL